MDGIDIGDFRRSDDPISLQITEMTGRRTDANGFISELDVQRLLICLGIDTKCLDPQLVTGSDDPQRDLAPVGNKDFSNHPER
jgi:hypothetical protein